MASWTSCFVAGAREISGYSVLLRICRIQSHSARESSDTYAAAAAPVFTCAPPTGRARRPW